MSSATTNRPSAAMTNATRSTRFGDFNSNQGRHNSDERASQPSTLGQTFGNGGAWQASGAIWGKNTIGSGFSNTKRDPSRSRGAENGEFLDGPSGSGALAASSEADPWVAHANGPWNPPDTTSPTLQSAQSGGSTSPSHVRSSLAAGAPSTLLEIQNQYTQSRPAGQGAAFTRSQLKSSLDPSSGPFKYHKPSFGFNDEKENSGQFLPTADSYDIDMSSRPFRVDQIGTQNSYLGIGNSASRDSSIPPSRASDAGFSGNGLGYGNGGQSYGSIRHTPSSSIHSHRPSFSGVSGSFPTQANGSRYEHSSQTEAELREKFAGFRLASDSESASAVSQGNSALPSSYSPNPPNANPASYQLNGGAGTWTESNGQKALNNFESYPSQPFADQVYFSKGPRLGDRGSVSPAASEYRRLNSPKYYTASSTPPTTSEQIYRPSSRGPRISQGSIDLDRRLQGVHFTQQAYLQYGQQFQGQFHGQFAPHVYEIHPPNFRQGAVHYGYPMPIPSYTPSIPTRPAKDQDIGHGVRSVLMEEFRANAKSNKRYELKDLYDHIVEFSGDQHGSRFIQQKLETANSDEKEQLFREIQPNALQLMTDVFGNYVIQKMFEHGNQVQKRVLAEQMKNQVMALSMQMYGCRVVQKALEHVLADQQAELVAELQADVLKCVKDQNGNHVIQKAIERVPTEHIQFVIEAFRGQVHVLASHPYGCRVIQRILEYCKPHDQANVLEELHQSASMLITDTYGNYVIQHVIEHGKPEDRAKIIKIITAQVLTLSKHKFASNVVEKGIKFGTDEQRKNIVAQLTALHSDGTSPLQLMMKDQYGNYVIQKLLLALKGDERESFIEDMKPQLISLKKYNYGKQIIAIEKLIPSATPYNASTATTQIPPIETNSSTPTPMLTNGQNSPQSSSVPSESVSTMEDSTNPATSGKGIEIEEGVERGDKICPEVVINGV